MQPSLSPPVIPLTSQRALLWVLVWIAYVVIALGWFGYQNALDGFICRVSR